jgi:hypothetical protein
MNTRYIPVENDPGYVVDPLSSAILNTNTHALIEYKQKRKQTKLIQDMKDEINMLKAEIYKIKNHLNLS